MFAIVSFKEMINMKYLKMLILFIVFVPVICLTTYRFMPVSFDAGACGRGFETYIYNKNIDNLKDIYAKNNSITSEISHSNDYTVGYQGRNIFINTVLSYEKDEDTITEEVNFKGKRIWTEMYLWEQIKPGL